uniref:Uncharacterized protein n=1 Tax=Trichogramma kaykai TaxID=54128 RepID=A0ABD2W7T6_9HYME
MCKFDIRNARSFSESSPNLSSVHARFTKYAPGHSYRHTRTRASAVRVCMCSLYVLRAPLPPRARVAFYERGERHAQVRDRERREIESKGLLKVAAAAAAAAHGAISPSATATAPIHYTYIGILAHAQMHIRARPGRARGLGVTDVYNSSSG